MVKTQALKFRKFSDGGVNLVELREIAKVCKEPSLFAGEGSNFVYDSPHTDTIVQIATSDERFRGLNPQYFAGQDRVRTDDFEDLLLLRWRSLLEPFDGLNADPFGDVQKFEQFFT